MLWVVAAVGVVLWWVGLAVGGVLGWGEVSADRRHPNTPPLTHFTTMWEAQKTVQSLGRTSRSVPCTALCPWELKPRGTFGSAQISYKQKGWA